ncbi:MAG: T9SS type A sorting domain-containing protein, partial [Flavobacterium sp.]
MGTNPAKVYMHAGIGDETNAFGFSVVGNWGVDDGLGLMTNNGNGTWSITITPSTYFGLNSTQEANATKMGMVFRNATGSQTLKLGPSCGDFIFNVGTFQATLNSPANNSATIINSGGSLSINATNTNGNAIYTLKANGITINTNPSTSSYSFTHSGITANQSYVLEITQGASMITRKFSVIVNPGTISAALPSGLEDGINYNVLDPTTATLVLTAPGKDFVYVAGSFNNWQPDATYAMRKDPATGKFWLLLTGITPGQTYTYQYWVVDTTPFTNSPALVKTADPFSTLVLSPFDDPYIPASTYPNLPAYPVGQEREVTVLQTGQTPYNWQVTNFNKPKKEDLIVEEVLIRDFDVDKNFQDVINRVQYFKNLKVNAIELMPVMEFEGNESWGYNTAFHLALDKFYGPESKLKELIDVYHQNGIAVILDVALNHAFGRNPMVRMWMKDPDGDGWGDASAESPYFNEFATHSYGVGNDFNHQQPLTKAYVKRVIKHWIEDFHIDGFRWDLTKGFTQNCTGNDACTNSYQQDRVDILKEYVDYAWNIDPTHYAIFEHLGPDNEEQQWADYRISETPSKGVMMWSEMTYAYSQLIEGYATGADISRMGSTAHGFTAKRALGYTESHDKERLMYSAMTYGNAAGTAPPYNNLNNSLGRMPAIEAISLLIPGPKMLWHFGELGNQHSIYECENGTVNDESSTVAGDCKLATKQQHQWTENWLSVPLRAQIYNDVAKMNQLKINEPVFEGNYAISPDANNIKQRVYIYDDALPSTQLKNVVIIANFSVATQSINPSFPYTGTWYNLMDNTSMNVTNATATISLGPGQYRIYGNQLPSLNNDQFEPMDGVTLYPNPATSFFTINTATSKVLVYSLTGQLVKEFKGLQADGYEYNVSDLNTGLYLVKVTDENSHEKTMRFIKQ